MHLPSGWKCFVSHRSPLRQPSWLRRECWPLTTCLNKLWQTMRPHSHPTSSRPSPRVLVCTKTSSYKWSGREICPDVQGRYDKAGSHFPERCLQPTCSFTDISGQGWISQSLVPRKREVRNRISSRNPMTPATDRYFDAGWWETDRPCLVRRDTDTAHRRHGDQLQARAIAGGRC